MSSFTYIDLTQLNSGDSVFVILKRKRGYNYIKLKGSPLPIYVCFSYISEEKSYLFIFPSLQML